ncbi:hypothetical protein RDI58_013990 [Solanum bulbocastanum]|uniref:Uncharacterized protein n=1 Tax=Solanum bulbocastanum TaxID=147425 RepID=A0AAN8TLZ7_SOLBU
MEVTKVLHMNGGIGNSSYAKNSLLQQKVILMTKSITNKVIFALYNNLSPGETIRIADLGCSFGPNTFLTISQLIQTIHEECKSNGQQQSPEFMFSSMIFLAMILTPFFDRCQRSMKI